VSRSPKITGAQRVSTSVHEGTHEWVKKDLNRVMDDGFSATILRSKDETKDWLDGKQYDYLTDPSEIHARVMETRHHFKLKPGEKIDADKAYDMVLDITQGKTPVDPAFGGIFSSAEGIAKLFNKYWSVPVAGTIGVKTMNNNKKKKED
jgi:hypothetical protein